MYDEIILVLGGYTQVEIPVLNITDSITGEQIVSDFFIDWGDGTAVERIVSSTGDINASTRHTYADTSDKIVRMSGIVPCIDYKYYLYNFGGNPNSLKQILLFKNQHIRRVNFCFCRELTYVASKAFDIPSAQHIQELFYNCSKLEAIPGDLFYYNKQFNSISSAFSGCTSISYVPSGLFHGMSEVITANNLFYGCSGLIRVESGAFSGLFKLERSQFMFYACTNLTELENGFLGNVPNLRNAIDMFNACYLLESIQSDIFEGCYNLENLSYAFMSCRSLKNIPNLENCQNIYNFTRTFSDCYELSGVAPSLWLRTNVTSHGMCFYDCKKLSNYAAIPSAWK